MVMINSTQNRNYSLDAIRMIAAVLVVFQHAIGKGIVVDYLLALSRIAVPLFMMISGFMYYDVVKKDGEIRQIKKFIRIAFVMLALYFGIDFGRNTLRGTGLTYLQSISKPKDLLKFILLNDPTVADHSWYMWAMIYTLVFVKFFPIIYKSKKIRRSVIIIGIVLSLIFGKYSLVIFDVDIPPTFTRNVWAVAMPYFLIGIELSENKNEIMNAKTKNIEILTLLFIFLCILERYVLVSFNINGTRDSYIFLAPLSIAAFMLLYKIPVFSKKNILAIWGRKYSLVLYIIHPLFVRVEYALVDMKSYWKYMGFLGVLVISFLFSMAINWMDNCLKNTIKRK